MSVNAEKTTDLSDIQFDAVHDEAFSVNRADRHRVGEPVSEVSGIQEGRSEKPEPKRPTSLVCSLRCADGWEFINSKKSGSDGFLRIFAEKFAWYKDESEMCDEQRRCSCQPSAFLEEVMEGCKAKKVRYPKAMLRVKKEFEELETKHSANAGFSVVA